MKNFEEKKNNAVLKKNQDSIKLLFLDAHITSAMDIDYMYIFCSS
jgi:hypothetical protein